MKKEQKSLIEAAKELLRVIMSAGIAYLLTEGVIDGIITLAGGHMDVTQKWLISGLLTSLVRSIDRYMHVNPNIESKGFLPK